MVENIRYDIGYVRGDPQAAETARHRPDAPWAEAYAAGGFGTAYRRMLLWRHRAHRRRTMRAVSPLCTPRREFPVRPDVRPDRGARPPSPRRPGRGPAA